MDWVSGQREWIGNGEIGVRIQHLTRKKKLSGGNGLDKREKIRDGGIN